MGYLNKHTLLNILFVLTACLSAQGNPAAANNRVSEHPVPDWVKLHTWDSPSSESENGSSEGMQYLLYETQEHPQVEERFYRIVVLMKNETGVQNFGTLSIDFDQAFHDLMFHKVQVYRNGNPVDKLNISKVKIIQPESQLDSHMFTGQMQALMFVEDLRVGDVLEYMYTLRGTNPAFKDHYSSSFYVQNSVSIDRKRFRVLWPEGENLQIRNHQTDAQPKITQTEGLAEYLWDFPRYEAVIEEDWRPLTLEPYAYIELSNFPDWASVVDWALPLYRSEEGSFPEELRQLIDEWKQTEITPAAQALKALKFVQDEIRYTGIELGKQAYQPAHPFETFRMRYGDCKGKSTLLCVILREMGITAYPALVNSVSREQIASHLPSPTVFNHVIVQLELDGNTIWVDPTSSHQGGGVTEHFLAHYGKGLVIKKGNSSLDRIQPADIGSKQHVETVFTLNDYESPAELLIKTVSRGYEADNLRQHMAEVDVKEIGREYLNYCARFYPGTTESKPLKIEDNRFINRIESVETYSTTNLWFRNKEDFRWDAEFWADNLNQMLPQPDTSIRKMPLAITYPLHRTQTVHINFPDDEWDIAPEEIKIDHAAFSFSYSRKLVGKRLELTFECFTKAPQIPAESVSDYLEKRTEMQNSLVCSLFRHDEIPAGADTNWMMVFIATMGALATIAGCLLFAFLTGKKKKKKRSSRESGMLAGRLDTRYKGLGGWLILVGIGVCIGPIYTAVGLYQLSSAFSLQTWEVLTNPAGAGYHPLYAPILIMEILGNIGFMGFNLLLIHHFFSKKQAFPMLFILIRVSNLIFVIIDTVLAAQIPDIAQELGSEIATLLPSTIIWCLYMVKSVRVKNTFTK